MFRYIIIPLIIFCGFTLAAAQWFHYQLQQSEVKNQELSRQNLLLNHRISMLKTRLGELSGILSREMMKLNSLKETNNDVREKINKALHNDSCAHRPVPDDVIRVQRDEILRDGSVYFDTSKSARTESPP